MKKFCRIGTLLGALLFTCVTFNGCWWDKDDDPVDPVLTPSEVTLAENATETVSISEGEAPYQLSGGNVSIASVTLNGNSISIKGLSKGSTAVTVKGDDGGATELVITVTEAKAEDLLSPVLTPAEVSVAEGAEQTVSISGGKAPYQLSGGNAGIASVTLNGNSITVKGLSVGNSSVTIKGSDGGSSELVITVTEAEVVNPVLTPSVVDIRVDDETTVAVSNGVIPYQLSGGDAGVASVAIHGNSITVRGVKVGTSVVTVSGKNGGTAELTINVEEKLSVLEEDRYNEFVTPELEYVLTEILGMDIHRGISPPDITGYFRMETYCTYSTISGDPYVGELIDHYKMKFYDQEDIEVSLEAYEVNYGNKEDYFIARHDAPGTFICGEGDNFSVFFNETTQYPEGPNTVSISVYSGTLDKDVSGKVIGIKNFQMAFLMRDNAGREDIIGNGQGRLFEDEFVDVITKEKFETLIYQTGAQRANLKNQVKSIFSIK